MKAAVKRLFCGLLALALCLSMMPTAARAAALKYAQYKGVDFMNANISQQRKAALTKAMQMVYVTWTSPADFPTWRATTSGVLNTVQATDGTRAQKFIKGKTYTGIPYCMIASRNRYDDISWANDVSNGTVTSAYMTCTRNGGDCIAYGSDCSAFVYHALKAANAGKVEHLGTSKMLNCAYYSKISWDALQPADLFLKNGHVMMFVGMNGSKYAVFECDASDAKCSYNEYNKTDLASYECYSFNGFTDSPVHTEHTYSGSYHEAAHPHRVYQKCSCGATQYTGATTTDSGCDTCNPVSTSSKYNAVLPFKAYLKGTDDVLTYSTKQLSTVSGEIWAIDECTITAVYSNGVCKVQYPAGGKIRTGYTYLSHFIGNTGASLARETVDTKIITYIRPSTSSTQYGYTDPGDRILKLGTSGNMTQAFYPTPDGYKLAWLVTSELSVPTYDQRFNPYCPIKGYPCVSGTFDVYESDHVTYKGKIFISDYCTINKVFADGWCEVTYQTKEGDKTAHAQLSKFVSNTSAAHVKYTANAQIKVHKNSSLPGDLNWYISPGDTFFTVSTSGNATQVLYPIDAQYGGGYKLGWIRTSDLPKTTYTVSYHANGGSGAPTSQTKTHGVALTLSTAVPTRSGYTFAGWATSSNATSAVYAPGAGYATDAAVTLYAVWKLNKYEISYNANGGSGAPAAQSKTHGTSLTLSGTVPVKHYTITFNPNGGEVDLTSRQIACTFLGWSADAAATAASYQPGGIYAANSNTVLYAVWQNNKLDSYPIPTRNGYTFDGWYTAASGGTKVTVSTVITGDTALYAHWTAATYHVEYDANGGTGAPDSQIKNHGQNLVLSNAVPKREGYQFLGWGMEENPDSAQYQPGGTYSADCDTVLIAVWGQSALTKIQIASKPAKAVYQVGDTLDIAGLILKASYSDGSVRTIAEGFSCTPMTLSTPGNQNITVSYGGKTVIFTVTVEAKEEADPNGPQIRIEEITGRPGSTVTLKVYVENNPGFSSAALNIQYDDSRLSLLDAEFGEVFAGGAFTNYNLPYMTLLRSTDTSENGVLAILTFDIPESASPGDAGVSIAFNDGDITNYEEEDVPFHVVSGNIAVVNYIPGDINDDGVVNTKDLTRLLRYISREAVQVNQYALDVNGDGQVNTKDLTRLLKYISHENVEIY